MKGISVVLSTIIMTSLVLILGLIVAYFAITTINNSVSSASYELSINAFSKAMYNYDLIANGGSYVIEFPMREISIGYNFTSKRFEVLLKIDSDVRVLINDSSIYEIYVKGPATITLRNSIIYGSEGLIVNSLTQLPMLSERYIPGKGQYIVFNTSRVSLFRSMYTIGSNNITILCIIYSDIVPSVIKGATTNRLLLSLGNKTVHTITIPIQGRKTISINATLYNSNGSIENTMVKKFEVSNTELKIYIIKLIVNTVIS